MRSISSLIAVGALGVLAFGASASFGQDADAQLNAFFKQYLEESFRQRPLEATRLGDHRFDHLLDDVTERGRAAWIEHDRNTLADLPRRVDLPKLSPAAKIDAEISSTNS